MSTEIQNKLAVGEPQKSGAIFSKDGNFGINFSKAIRPNRIWFIKERKEVKQ